MVRRRRPRPARAGADLQGLRLPEKSFFGLALVVLEVDPRLEAYPWAQWLGQAASRRARRLLVFVRTRRRQPAVVPVQGMVQRTGGLPGPSWAGSTRPGCQAGRWRPAKAVASAPPRDAPHRNPGADGRRLAHADQRDASAGNVESSRGTVSGEELVSMDGLGLGSTGSWYCKQSRWTARRARWVTWHPGSARSPAKQSRQVQGSRS